MLNLIIIVEMNGAVMVHTDYNAYFKLVLVWFTRMMDNVGRL